MSNKIIKIVLIILFLINIYLLYIISVLKKEIKLANNLSNYKSVTYLYALNNNKKSLKLLLQSDIVQLVHDYNDKDFNSNKILSNICKDWKSNIKPYVLKYILKNNHKNSSKYYNKVKNNIYKLDKKCKE